MNSLTFSGQCFKRIKFYNKNNYDINIYDTDKNIIQNTYCKSKKKKNQQYSQEVDSDFLPDSD